MYIMVYINKIGFYFGNLYSLIPYKYIYILYIYIFS